MTTAPTRDRSWLRSPRRTPQYGDGLASLVRQRLATLDRPPGPGELLAPARVRPRRRHRRPRQVAAVAAVALAAAASVAATARAEGAADRWGEPTDAVVVRHPVPAGGTVDASAVDHRSVPAAMVPPGAALDVEAVAGRVAAVALVPGEVLVVDRLAPTGAHGVAGALAPGYRAVAVPLAVTVPELQVGQRIDLLAPVPSSDSGGPGSGAARQVAAAVEVLALTDDVALVAVHVDDVRVVAGALAGSPLAVAIVGARP